MAPEFIRRVLLEVVLTSAEAEAAEIKKLVGQPAYGLCVSTHLPSLAIYNQGCCIQLMDLIFLLTGPAKKEKDPLLMHTR